MKTNIAFKFFCATALTLGFSACTDNPDYPGGDDDKTGSVSLTGLMVEVDPSEIELSRADIDTSNYLVKIFNAAGDMIYESTFAERNEIVSLPVAQNYSVEVQSHEVQNAAWSAPYYAGKKSFDITENTITPIGTVNCVFSNVRVSVRYTDELQKMLGNDVVVNVNCSETGSSLDFVPSETRSGYFKALQGSTTLGACLTGTILGQYVTVTKALNNIAAGQHRIITFGVSGGDPEVPDEYGSITIEGEGSGVKLAEGLYLDVSVTTVDSQGNVTVDEDADSSAVRPGTETPPEPPIGEAITITSSTMSFTTPMDPSTITSGVVNIHSDNGIKNLIVKIATTSSDFASALEGVGMPTTFDLAYPKDADEEAIFDGFGFPFGSNVQGAKDIVFDITTFVPLLSAFKGTHTFTITVNDVSSNTLSKSLAFEVK